MGFKVRRILYQLGIISTNLIRIRVLRISGVFLVFIANIATEAIAAEDR